MSPAATAACAMGVADCAIDATGACANYNGEYANLLGVNWLIVLAFLIMAVYAFYIGANDVANAWGTSVGSKAITVRWACIIAGLMNWLGAVTLGYGVSTTIENGVSDINDPECWACGYCDSSVSVYGIAMFAALIGGAIFMMLATFTRMPVSTTHAIVGGVVGVTIWGAGGNCLNWAWNGGLGGIIASWIISPVLSGIIGVIIYYITEFTIFRTKTPDRNAMVAVPILYGLVGFILVFLIILKSKHTKQWNKGIMVAISAVVFVVVAAAAQFFLVPFIRKRLPSNGGQLDAEDPNSHKPINTPAADTKDALTEQNATDNRVSIAESVISQTEKEFREEEDSKSTEEKDALFTFRYLIVLVASLESYAHGTNDTANATSALSAVYNVYDNGLDSCSPKSTQVWIMAIAGFMVFVGINVQGHRVMKTIGRSISIVNMHRGFCMELASTVTVIIASLLKLPVSTTHCQVGAVIFISMAALGPKKVSFGMAGKIAIAWVVTLPFAGVVAAAFGALFKLAL